MTSSFKNVILLASACFIFGNSLEAIDIPGFGGGGGANRNVFITMSKSPNLIIDQIAQQNFPNRETKLAALRNGLLSHSINTQSPILKFLGTQAIPIQYDSIWISNQIYLKGVNSRLLSTISSLYPSDIASISDETFSFINYAYDEEPYNATVKQSNSYTWGLNKIQAPEAWSLPGGNNGAGIVVGSIDTGVLRTHEALVGNYVGEYGWFDPTKLKTSTPTDVNGHGTHTVGTMVGIKGIGVAPGAKWMACRGCETNSCAESDLLKCGEFMTCPTDANGRNPNCAKAPHVINNSWGGGRSNGYDTMVRAWRAGNIIPVFAIGNNGPECRKTSSPGNNADVIGVGSTTKDNQLSGFSSKGPHGRLTKPDLSAPGSVVRSAGKDRNNQYIELSGTSMASPHVAGVVALMLSAKRNMTYNTVKNILLRSCTTDLRKPSQTCDSRSTYTYPNSEYGQGLINAKTSLQMAISS